MIYNWLIKHKKPAYGIAFGFLIFTILVYAFQSCWFVRHIYNYIDYWAIPLSAAFMLVLAYMAYISIAENRRMRLEDKELNSIRRRLREVQDWIDVVLKLNSECAMGRGDHAEWRQREARANNIIANEQYVKIEVKRLGFDSDTRTKLVDIIERLSYMFKTIPLTNLSAPLYQKEITDKSNEALEIISNLKDELKL